MTEGQESLMMISDEIVMSKIYFIRGQKVMLDADLAELYGTETKKLKQQVNRNLQRFPEPFMFELTKEEYDALRSQFVTLKRGEHSKYLPYVFTEHDILMLSNVLKSEKAIAVSIQIMNIFVKIPESLANQIDIGEEIESVKKKLGNQDRHLVFAQISMLSNCINLHKWTLDLHRRFKNRKQKVIYNNYGYNLYCFNNLLESKDTYYSNYFCIIA